MARVHGVDVSQWQSTMNWTTCYNAGARFAFAKATEGVGFTDPQWANNFANAKNAGLLFGAYHFPTPSGVTDANADGLADDAVAEADAFYSTASAAMVTGYMRPVLDMEAGSALSQADLSKWTNDFCTRIKNLTGVDPIVYCNTNYATNELNSTVAIHDLWIANYSSTTYGPVDTTPTGPPTGNFGTNVWDFWQYSADGNGLGATYGAGSSAIDQDVFRGASNGADPTNDLQLLKQNFIIGAPKIPTITSPANGATNISPLNVTLNWADSVGATRYDVYLDNMVTPIATNVAVSQYNVGNIAGGAHTWKVVAKQASNDDDTFVSSPTWSFTASSLPLPGTPSGGTPNGTIQTTKPLVLDWSDSSAAATYDVYLGTAANLPLGTPSFTGLTGSQTTSISPAEGTRLWRVVARNATGDTVGPLWSYTMDSVAPTASYGAQAPTGGSANFDFTVTYSDATSGINFTTIDSGDIVVNGPNGYSESATLIGVDVNSNGSPRTATYRVAAPGGSWDAADNGEYTVAINTNQVKDMGGLAVASVTGNTFAVGFSDPFAWQVGSTLHVDFSKTATGISIGYSGGQYSATAESTLNFTGVTSVVAHGTADDDVLTLASAMPPALAVDFTAGGAGHDMLEVSGAAGPTFASDLGAGAPNLVLKLTAGASATLSATQHLRGLDVASGATVNLTAGGAKALVVGSLTLAATGGTYGGIAGEIQRGVNGGGWDGTGGLITSQPDATAGLTTLGIGEASAILGIDGTATAVFAGETVDATAVLVKYTYAGDANLDGTITGDDYSAIDFNIQVPGSDGYFNGDFNYDGLVTGDDYSAIDFNIIAQGAPL
jgi:GH25 family lysozyme M1 (1,4-beta-N-acetylmuramidase)